MSKFVKIKDLKGFMMLIDVLHISSVREEEIPGTMNYKKVCKIHRIAGDNSQMKDVYTGESFEEIHKKISVAMEWVKDSYKRNYEI